MPWKGEDAALFVAGHSQTPGIMCDVRIVIGPSQSTAMERSSVSGCVSLALLLTLALVTRHLHAE